MNQWHNINISTWGYGRQLEKDVRAGNDASGMRGHSSQAGNYRRWSDIAPLNHLVSPRKGSNGACKMSRCRFIVKGIFGFSCSHPSRDHRPLAYFVWLPNYHTTKRVSYHKQFLNGATLSCATELYAWGQLVQCFEVICDGELGYGDSSKPPLHERSSGGKAEEGANLPPEKACHKHATTLFLQLCP